MAVCILCFRTEAEVNFNLEHVIPDSVGGALVVPDMLCCDCNSDLGSTVDHHLLKNPKIVAALSAFDVEHDRETLLNNNYDISGQFEGLSVRGRATPDGFRLNGKRLDDGSLLVPESEYEADLRKIVARDERLREAGLSEAEIDSELDHLLKKYEVAEVGERVEAPRIGVALRKRSDRFKILLQPRQTADMVRATAKVAYEFGYLVGGGYFIQSFEYAQLLHQLVVTGDRPPKLHVRQLFNDGESGPYHSIELFQEDHRTRVRVILFGSAAYEFLGPPLSLNVFQDIEADTARSDVTSVEYQQNLADRTYAFRAFYGETEYIQLFP